MIDPEMCGRCRFAKPLPFTSDRVECHKKAPRPDIALTSGSCYPAWPQPWADDWCGEFQPRAEREEGAR